MNWPGVSVIIPAHDSAATLRACLRSVLRSDYEGDYEVIVVDDGSADETPTIAQEMGCRLIRRRSAEGPASARNTGARAARYELLLFLDSDTQMLTDTIRRGVEAIQQPQTGAVSGVYEREPINEGFFPRYYAYLKRHAFESSSADEISAFGAQCAIISKQLFREVGGFLPIRWGVDIENDELGARISRRSKVALCRRFRIKHHFPTLRKLLYVFTGRVYWWMIFSHFSKRTETVLMTRGFGLATAMFPCSLLLWIIGMMTPDPTLRGMCFAAGAGAALWFASAYMGFWRFCRRHGGWVFALGAAPASALFSLVITLSAMCGVLAVIQMAFLRRQPPYARTALETP